MIGDHYRDMWQPKPWYPNTLPAQMPTGPAPIIINQPEITRAEFDELKRQVLEMKELLKRAKEYDERTGQADCEMDEKMAILRKVAQLVGINLDDVLKPAAQ